jgi:hypothetical protein
VFGCRVLEGKRREGLIANSPFVPHLLNFVAFGCENLRNILGFYMLY